MLKKTNLSVLFLLLFVFAGNGQCNPAAEFVKAARNQVGKTVLYDPSYQVLAYPNGDVPMDRGVCTDVVIRAMRTAFGLDLQKQVHEDMETHFSLYPDNWGLKFPDKNIDHRRVPNLQTYFKRQGWGLDISTRTDAYKPGDIVTCRVPPHLPHIMIVSDRRNRKGVPYVIHNIGRGAKEDDCLFEFEITGHFRIKGVAQASAESLPNVISD